MVVSLGAELIVKTKSLPGRIPIELDERKE
jgi:hypothetical protein